MCRTMKWLMDQWTEKSGLAGTKNILSVGVCPLILCECPLNLWGCAP
jgi:hypothetical protein